MMDEEVVTIVSGLPRSGTSMLMKMLEAGGIKPLTDRIRTADTDNPKGYYEFERVKKLPKDSGWLKDARGKAVKVLAELVKHLPPEYTYRVLFMQRDFGEMIESQKKMLARKGRSQGEASDKEVEAMFRKYLEMIKAHINRQPNIEVLYINYNKVMDNPGKSVKEINAFCGGVLKEEEMKSVIDEGLYRNRRVTG